MSKEKQIEGLAEAVRIGKHAMCDVCSPNGRDCEECETDRLVNAIYNAGYRKQSEGEWIEEHGKTYIPAEYNENGHLILHDYTVYVCSVCGRKEPKKEPYCNCGAKMKGV